MSNEDPIAVEAEDAAIVSKAMIRAAEQLDIPNQTFAGVIRIPETTVIQMRLRDAVLSSDAKGAMVPYVRSSVERAQAARSVHSAVDKADGSGPTVVLFPKAG
jgi:hypothetical protein